MLTHIEAMERAALLEVTSCDISLDLTATQARSRTELRFRCRRPGAETFADLTASLVSASLNGRPVGSEDGRIALSGLAAENVLIVDAEVPDDALSRHGDYLLISCFPTDAPTVFACFDQPDIGAITTLTVTLPDGWECLANGVALGNGRFAPVRSMKPFEFAVCAGPFAGNGKGLWYRPELANRAGRLASFDETARATLRYYEERLGVPWPYPKYDIVFHPELPALAMSVPGLMVVNENVLDRMSYFADEVARHEVAHQWFGCLVGMRWWNDLWIDEALSDFVSSDWVTFAYRAAETSYHADEMPGSVPVSSPVETAAQALDRPTAITYGKGAAAIRQLAALIGEDALYRGLNDYLTRFTVSARLEDLVECWSRASGRDIAAWADEWLRTAGHSTLRLDGGAVVQQSPRTHRIDIGLYDLDGDRLRRRRVIGAEISGPRTEIPDLAGDAVILNEGGLTFARVAFDERTFAALRAVALNTGDPMSEAVCWTTAWHMVTTAELPAAEFVELVTRRLRLDPPLPVPGLEVLTTRAVTAADVWAPAERRAALRELLADEFFNMTKRRPADPAVRHALTAGFAASAESSSQLGLLRAWLSESWADSALRWKFLGALSARGLAADAEIEAMAAADPAGGETAAATCLARRPDQVSKAAAWAAALEAAAARRWRMARAHAEGFWVPGQEALLRAFRDRYFGEALPMLISLSGADPSTASQTRRLATLLFPATLAEEATVTAVSDALSDPLPKPWHDLLTEREIELRLRIFSES